MCAPGLSTVEKVAILKGLLEQVTPHTTVGMASDKGIASPGKQASDLKDPADVAQSMSGMVSSIFFS